MANSIKFMLLFVAILFIITSCTNSDQSSGIKYSFYTNTANGYSYDVPLNFVQVDIPGNDVGFVDNDTKLLFSSLGIPLQGNSFDEVYNEFRQSLPEALDGQILLEENLIVDGNNARKMLLTYAQNGVSFKYTVVLVYNQASDKLVMISFAGPSLDHDSNLHVFQHAVDSLEFN